MKPIDDRGPAQKAVDAAFAKGSSKPISTHTPGPWTVSKGSIGYLGQADSQVPTLFIEQDHARNEPKVLVATLSNNVVTKNMEANARLIAAAPELLAALEDLLDLGRAGFIQGADIAVTRSVEQARAVIRSVKA
jgi:hypothetical protein